MAYRTDGTANFNFFINRQGPRGPQGIQGPEGFSPNVQVEEDHGNTFTLRVTNKDNFFITSNLREHKEDRGGDYIRYDRAGQLMYIGDPNFATTVKAGEVRLSTIDDLTAGSDTVALTPKVYKDDVTSRVEKVNQRINSLDANNVKVTGDQAIDGRKVFRDRIDSNYVYTDHVYGYSGSGGRIFTNEDNLTIGNTQKRTILYTKGAGITLNGNTNYILTQDRVTAGDGVAIEKTTSGIKISSTDTKYILPVASSTTLGGIKVGDNLSIAEDGTLSATSGSSEPPANMVTTDTEQTITGVKTFSQNVNIQGFANGVILLGNGSGAGRILANKDYGGIEIYGRVHSSDNWGRVASFLGNGVLSVARSVSIDGKIAYHRGNLIAGEGINFSSVNGITTISSTGGGGDVTLAGDNSFTGNNTFDGVSTFNGDTWINSLKVGTSLKNQQDKKFLVQGSITTGSDNLLITDTTDGVQIICNAPTNAQIEALQRLINDLSTKIDNLTTRLNNLEEVIDGGVAGSIYAPEPQKLQEQVVEGVSINEKTNNVTEDVQEQVVEGVSINEKINNVTEDVQVNDNGGT